MHDFLTTVFVIAWLIDIVVFFAVTLMIVYKAFFNKEISKRLKTIFYGTPSECVGN